VNELRRDELCYLSIPEVAVRIANRELSCVEVTRAVLERIDAVDRRLNSYITVMVDQALDDAASADRAIERGANLGPLHGVPIGLKDLYQTRGVRTTGGSKILADWVPETDSTVTARLRRAGAIIVGKQNMHEFAFGVSTDNPHYGRALNPWSAGHSPGGSSGGSAAAVAAGLGYASMGSDTGGSIRMPASMCGVVGHKPTYGLVSRHGVLPLAWSMDHAGPFGRTVADVALVMNAIAGHDPRDPASANRIVVDYAASLEHGSNGMRIGVLSEYLGDDVAADVRAAVRASVDALAREGATIREVSMPTARYALGASTAMLFAEAAAVHERWLRERPADYGADVLDRLRAGARLSATHYLKGQRARRMMLDEATRLLENVDVLVCPSVPRGALPWELTATNDGRDASVRFTRLFNILGLPACSVPCGLGADGLPMGMQIVGRPFEDATVFRVARAHEIASGGFVRPPESAA
jgi:aspartyl-tRNA(Asn)/glutamyl-tRNA(Gln) amidotransferase subunit A